MNLYKTYRQRIPDSQYQSRLRTIIETGILVEDTPQEVGALTCFGTLPAMVFDVENGAPLITERSIPFWRAGIGEICAFINGATDLKTFKEFGVNFWGKWATERKSKKIDESEGSLGPGSYGGAFAHFPMPDGGFFNQIEHLVEQLKNPDLHKRRTLLVSPWIPFWNGWGGMQKAVVSPCHGWLHLRVISGELHMRMDQRSADFPIGVPMNMIQYFALLLMVAQVTGLKPKRFIHTFSDAHVYVDQLENVEILTSREPRRLSRLSIDPGVEDIFSFRAHHFEVSEYRPHPEMSDIPVAV